MMTRFNAGDKIRIIKRGAAGLDIGTVAKVVSVDDDGDVCLDVNNRAGFRAFYLSNSIELVTPSKPKKSARITALETQVAELQAKVEALESAGKYPNTARFERESAEVDATLADIKRKAKPVKSPNEQRADVIKRAKAFVAEWVRRAGSITKQDGNSDLMNRGSLSTEFIVNAEKRTVVCIAKSCTYGCIRGKGIAKCDPSDVFNADIGKAIALGRALGVDVAEFTKAIQPTEVVLGQTLQSNVFRENFYEATRTSDDRAFLDGSVRYYLFSDYPRSYRIADDTDAVYE